MGVELSSSGGSIWIPKTRPTRMYAISSSSPREHALDSNCLVIAFRLFFQNVEKTGHMVTGCGALPLLLMDGVLKAFHPVSLDHNLVTLVYCRRVYNYIRDVVDE